MLYVSAQPTRMLLQNKDYFSKLTLLTWLECLAHYGDKK